MSGSESSDRPARGDTRRTTAGQAERPVTASDVARVAGVSNATLSRFMTKGGYVSEAARERITKAVRDLGYVADRRAASLTTKHAGLIGFLVSDLRNPFTAALATEAQLRAREHGYAIVLSNSMGDPALAADAVRTLRAHAVDGVLLTPPVDAGLTAELGRTIRTGTPAVGIGLHLEPAIMDVVTVDTHAGASLLMDHLLSRGHTRIGFAGSPEPSGRLRAHHEALTSAGLEADPGWALEPSDHVADWAARLERLVLRADGPTAYLSLNDETAARVLQAAARMGLRVPADLSVTGFDDVPLAADVAPPLTTVRQPVADLARAAVDALVARMEGLDVPPHLTTFTPELVIRDSVGAPGVRPWQEGARR